MMSIGQVMPCRHCDGSGKCNCEECQKKANTSSYGTVKSSACEGWGYNWIGPQIVYLPPDTNR